MVCVPRYARQNIRADLERTLDKTKLSTADVAHESNEKAGLDKFKTMKKAQSGLCMCVCVRVCACVCLCVSVCAYARACVVSFAPLFVDTHAAAGPFASLAGDARNRVADFESLEDTDC